MSRFVAVLLLIVPTAAACGGSECGGCNVPKPQITVFAAASLQPPFDEIARNIGGGSYVLRFNYAGTQTLTSQLTQGAQADVFASADSTHMKTIDDAGLVSGTSQVFAHNMLEIAVAKGNPKGIHALADLARSGLVVVLADPSVPAGKYALQALAKAGVTVKPASLELQVTGVLSKVALGEADAGIVYVSDIVTSGQVDGVAIPDSQNVVADYLIAVLKSSRSPGYARIFVDRLLKPDGQAVLKAAGFAGV